MAPDVQEGVYGLTLLESTYAGLNKPPISKNRTLPYKREDHTMRNDPCTCGSGKKYKKCCMKLK